MKILTLLSTELAPWLKSFLKWFGLNYKLIVICIASVVVILIILNWILSKKPKYEYLTCNGYTSRVVLGTEIHNSYRKNVHVRINHETGMYYFQDLDNQWYKLRKKHRIQIDESREKGIPEFDIPTRKQRLKEVA